MTHLPPRRAPRIPENIYTASTPKTTPQNTTQSKVRDILDISQGLQVKRRPFYPLWEKTRSHFGK